VGIESVDSDSNSARVRVLVYRNKCQGCAFSSGLPEMSRRDLCLSSCCAKNFYDFESVLSLRITFAVLGKDTRQRYYLRVRHGAGQWWISLSYPPEGYDNEAASF
jgi:hypothetical protein